MAAPLPFVVAVVLAAASVGGAAVPSGLSAPSGPTISLTVHNWGKPVSALDPGHPAWGRLNSAGGPQTVTLTIATNGEKFLGYAAALTAPDAPGGVDTFHCSDENHVIESAVVCQFSVPLGQGRNRLDVLFQALNDDTPVMAHGVVFAGELQSGVGLQVQRDDGSWQNVPDGSRVEVSPDRISALRYMVYNSGGIPFRVKGSCSKGAVHPDGILVCPLRADRPGIALAGGYHVPVHLVDAAGGSDSFTIDVGVDVAGAFQG